MSPKIRGSAVELQRLASRLTAAPGWLWWSLASLGGVLAVVLTAPREYAAAYVIAGVGWLAALFGLASHLRRRSGRSAFGWTAALLVGGLALCSFHVVLWNSGWPESHDGFAWQQRILIYYYHFRQLDFAPIWSRVDCFGLGTPLPLYYHKLFYYVAASLLLLIGQIKASVIAALNLFSIAGCYGMYRSFRLLELDRWSSLLLAPAIVFSSYTITDWLIRGNMAEHAALMLLTWIFYWCLKLIIQRRFSYSILPILWLTFLAHSVMAYFGAFCILLAVAVTLTEHFSRGYLRHVAARGLVSACGFGLLNAVYLVPMLALSHYYDPSSIKSGGMTVEHHFRSIFDYFIDWRFVWGRHYAMHSVEIGRVIWAFILLAGLARLIQRRSPARTLLRPDLVWWKEALVFVTLSLTFYLWLQHPSAQLFYRYVPGADYIQFPWRLAGYIQAAALLLLGALLAAQRAPLVRPAYFCFALLLVLVVTSPHFRTLDPAGWQWKPSDVFNDHRIGPVFVIGGPEYLPIVNAPNDGDFSWHQMLAQRGIDTAQPDACSLVPQKEGNPEALTAVFHVRCRQSTEVMLPINYSGLEQVVVDRGKRERLEAHRTLADSRLRCRLPRGTYRLVVHLPTLRTAFASIL